MLSPSPISFSAVPIFCGGQRVSYFEFTCKTKSLTSYLRSVTGLSKGDTAFILSHNLVQVPILYFSLLSLGVVISPANPISTDSEISWLVCLCNPVIAFATSSTAHKLPTFRFKTILLDSPEFDSMTISLAQKLDRVEVSQSDLAAIMYSSGTTGKVKGVTLTHRNLMAVVAVSCANRMRRELPDILLYTDVEGEPDLGVPGECDLGFEVVVERWFGELVMGMGFRMVRPGYFGDV
jgi:4-coumarate--CoA ligase